MSADVTVGGVRTVWDDETRMRTMYDASGAIVREVPYGNAIDTVSETDALALSTQLSIEEALLAALVTLQGIIDDDNTNINKNPAARIKDIAKVLRRVIRLVIRRFDGTT